MSNSTDGGRGNSRRRSKSRTPDPEAQLELTMEQEQAAADVAVATTDALEKSEEQAVPASGNGHAGSGGGHGQGPGPVRLTGEPNYKGPLRKRIDSNFLQYASYVIRDRAIPNLADGLKPVQRRILYALHRNDDGKFIKVANIVGYTMGQFHPHGDASIEDALVVLANKRYLIEGQGNFGNVFTGDPSAAARYIECRLTELARRELFNDELTEFAPTYDGRNQEPITLPAKLPLLLMLGAEGIAVGLSARILPHNFPELLEAQIAILRKKPFKVRPDFQHGCFMDASDYQDGNGSIRLRARIAVRNSSTLVIQEIPPATSTESVIASIEEAVRKGKIKVKSISDFTSEKVEIEIKLPPGVDADQMIPALYAFTSCETTITSRIVVIDKDRPVEMTVSEVLKHNTAKLLKDLKAELDLQEHKLKEELHFKTLVRIFVENRIYKKIETSRTADAVVAAIFKGFEPFRKEMYRAMTDPDVEMLLRVQIRRISLFDISKHREDMDKVEADLAAVQKNLQSVTRYAIARLQGLLKQYGAQYPRKTVIKSFDAVEAREVAFKTFKVTYDREKGYVGHRVGGEEFSVQCSDYDKVVLVFRDGRFKVVPVQERLFVGPDLVYCGVIQRDRVLTLAYSSKDATYLKRFTFGGTIMNKEYRCTPPKSKIVYLEPDTPAELFIKYKAAPYQKINQQTVQPADLTVKGAKSRGNQVSIKDVASITSSPPRGWKSDETTTRLRFV